MTISMKQADIVGVKITQKQVIVNQNPAIHSQKPERRGHEHNLKGNHPTTTTKMYMEHSLGLTIFGGTILTSANLKRVEIISVIFSNHNSMKLEIMSKSVCLCSLLDVTWFQVLLLGPSYF